MTGGAEQHTLDPGSSQVTTEAASWLAQIDAGPLSPTDRLALSEWISRSPRHAEEIKRLSALWGNLDLAIDEMLLGARRPKTSLAALFRAAIVSRPAAVASTLASVAVLLVIGVAATLNLVEPFETRSETMTSPVVLSVEKGSSLETALDDGSVVHLNTDTIVNVDFSDQVRSVRLLRGEALFDVRKDPERPFLVVVGDRIVRAIGTAFVVRIDDRQLAVTVTEGEIRLEDRGSGLVGSSDSESAADRELLYLNAGQRVVFDAHEIRQLDNLDTNEIERQTAWIRGDFVFDGDTLAHIVAEITRYNAISISMQPELREMRMGGTFKTGDVDRILDAMETYQGIEVIRNADGSIYLARK